MNKTDLSQDLLHLQRKDTKDAKLCLYQFLIVLHEVSEASKALRGALD